MVAWYDVGELFSAQKLELMLSFSILNSFLKFIKIHHDIACLGPCWLVWLTLRQEESLFPLRWLPTLCRQKRELKSSNEIYYNTSAFCLRSPRAFWFEQVIAKNIITENGNFYHGLNTICIDVWGYWISIATRRPKNIQFLFIQKRKI